MAEYGTGTMGKIDEVLGSRDVDFKPGSKAPEKIQKTTFYTLTNENTNHVDVRRKCAAGPWCDAYIGHYDENGKFHFDAAYRNWNQDEQDWLNSPEGSKEVLGLAATSAKADLMQNGSTRTRGEPANAAEATSEVREIFKTNEGAPEELTSTPTFGGTIGKASRTEFPGAKGKEPLIYPLSLGSTQQDVLQFNMLEYVSRGITPRSGSGVGARPKTSHRDIIGSVMLPIPGGIQSTNAVKWDEDPADVIQLAFGDAASNVIKGVEGAVTNLAEQARGNTTALKTLIANRFAEIAVGANKNTFLARATGAILNPNLELLFSAPTLRPFEFRFRLSPRSKDEAKSVVQIIRFFQQGMSPRTDGDLLFLKSPHTFQLKYLYRGSGEHPYLNSFKECALKLLQVNYTPENNYSTYEDGVMNSYEMTMQLQELQPVLNSDYDTGEGDAEGFPTNLNFADAQVSTKPGTTDYNPDSGYAPGYAPGDKEGSFI